MDTIYLFVNNTICIAVIGLDEGNRGILIDLLSAIVKEYN